MGSVVGGVAAMAVGAVVLVTVPGVSMVPRLLNWQVPFGQKGSKEKGGGK